MTFLVRVDIYIYIQNNENSFLKIYENQTNNSYHTKKKEFILNTI